MSIEAMSAVLNSDVGPTNKRFVLLAIANNANARGICWPGAASLVGATGVGRSTVFRILKELESDGLLQRRERRRENGSRRSNAYRLNLEMLAARRRVVSSDEAHEMEALFADADPVDGSDDVSAGHDTVPQRDDDPDQREPETAQPDPATRPHSPAAGLPPSRSGTGARPAAGPLEPSLGTVTGNPLATRRELQGAHPAEAGTPVAEPLTRRPAAAALRALPLKNGHAYSQVVPMPTDVRNPAHHPHARRAAHE